jgi:hypothetical protein
MKASLLATLLIQGLMATPLFALELFNERCCACVIEHSVAAPNGRELSPALFCRLVASPEELQSFNSECDGQNGAGLCLVPLPDAMQDNLDCDALLAGENIGCPADATQPAPVIGRPLMAVLVLLLAGLGLWAAGRGVRRARR